MSEGHIFWYYTLNSTLLLMIATSFHRPVIEPPLHHLADVLTNLFWSGFCHWSWPGVIVAISNIPYSNAVTIIIIYQLLMYQRMVNICCYHIFCCNMFVFACPIIPRSQCWLFALRANTRISVFALEFNFRYLRSGLKDYMSKYKERWCIKIYTYKGRI